MAEIVIHEAEGVGGKRKRRSKELEENEIADPSKSTVIYVGRIPHGFYEKEMREFFEQFGTITKLRISRNKLTGKSKHYGFIKFELPEVAAIVAESMNNYLLFESMLQVKLVPQEKLHPKVWVGANRAFKVLKFGDVQRKQHNKVRTPAEHKRQVKGLLKKDKQRRMKLKAAGIDFNFPDIRDLAPEKPKKVELEKPKKVELEKPKKVKLEKRKKTESEKPEKVKSEKLKKTESEKPEKVKSEKRKKSELEKPEKVKSEKRKKTEVEKPEKVKSEKRKKTELEKPEKVKKEKKIELEIPEKVKREKRKKTESEKPKKTESEKPKKIKLEKPKKVKSVKGK